MLRDSDIICLDEATSNLDEQTDKTLHIELFDYCKTNNKTLVVVTHRLENIDKFDKIIVMDNGEIVESGNI